jgi:hypothetical protein
METFSFRELEYDFVDVWGSLGWGFESLPHNTS